MPLIYFRCDGNNQIATGHIMRCLSIAGACAALHAKVCFLVSDEESVSVLKERFAFPNEFSIQCLHSDYQNMEAELPALRSIIVNPSRIAEPSCIFVDSYSVTEPYLRELGKLCRTAYLDDILAFDYPVDLIINYDREEEPACYRKTARKLLGAAYTPLREQFQNVSYEVRSEVQNILISTGGTDSYNAAASFLKSIFTLQADTDTDTALRNNYHYHVVTSRLNSHFGELKQLASEYPAIHIHEKVQNMAELMCRCDLALSAGGATLCELCAVGVPTVSFATADNQLNAVNAFSAKKIIPYAGDVRSSLDNVIHAVKLFLSENVFSYEKRKKSSQSMRAYIDGYGAARIAAELLR